MAVITELTEKTVCIRLDNGKLREVNRSELLFEPTIGDVVEVFIANLIVVVMKKETRYKGNSSYNPHNCCTCRMYICYI